MSAVFRLRVIFVMFATFRKCPVLELLCEKKTYFCRLQLRCMKYVLFLRMEKNSHTNVGRLGLYYVFILIYNLIECKDIYVDILI